MIKVFLTDALGAPEIEDIKGIANEAARLCLWDALKAGVVFCWVDSVGLKPYIDRTQVALPQWVKWQDIRLVIKGA
jgi:hypothetical protein